MWRLLHGDALIELRKLPAQSVQCVMTSPPYYGLRDYGVEGQIGLEPTMQEYIARLVEVFREVWRVLRDDGTVWLNLGDSFNAAHRKTHGTRIGNKQQTNRASQHGQDNCRPSSANLKPKDMMGIPWRVAFALQDDGWWLRSDIVWEKPNCMPESVTDRPTKSHEYIFLLTKSSRYFFDQEAVRKPHTMRPQARPNGHKRRRPGPLMAEHTFSGTQREEPGIDGNPAGRNLRSVWTISTVGFAEAHFATFPPALVERCLKAGTSEKGCCEACGKPWVRQLKRQALSGQERKKNVGGRTDGFSQPPGGAKEWSGYIPPETIGWRPSCSCNARIVPCTVLDPFCGAGTTILVADRLGRSGIGIELNPEYIALANKRISADAPLFAAL